MKRLVYETLNVLCFQLVFKLLGSIHHLPALFLHLTAETSVDFSFPYFFLFFLTFLPASVPLIQIQHLGVSGVELSYVLRFVDLTSSLAVWDKQANNTRAAPPRLLPWCSSAQCGKSTPNADICHIHLAASVKPSLPFPSPPHPPTKSSYLAFSSCEWTSERRDSAKSSWWLLFLLFIHVFIPPSFPAPPHWNEESPVSLHQVWSVRTTTSGCTSGPETDADSTQAL